MSTETPPSAEVALPGAAQGRRGRRHGREDEFTAETHVYEPHVVGLPPLRSYLREVWRRRDFAVELSRTKLHAKHFDTVFGRLWLILNPIMLAAVYFVLVDIIRSGHRAPGFFAHLLAGIFGYYLVSDALRDAVKSVTSGGRLILNSAFPRVLLPLASTITGLRRFLAAIFVYIPVHALSGLPVDAATLWVIPLLGLLVVLAAGFSMIVAAVQVYFRDLASFLPYLLRMWLYISPVLYFADDVPERYKILLSINPLGQLLAAWSDVLHSASAPSLDSMVIACAWAFGTLIVGFLLFVSREREFAVRL
ncbi:MAG: teichoic acid transport system permease protein [Solirubrobacteraceae bacterium]|jgi:teichoic acid transport system permease protein|nr:teichoic acid transport system permease protein [Solirubrobacteraceae bacterium]